MDVIINDTGWSDYRYFEFKKKISCLFVECNDGSDGGRGRRSL